MKKVTLTSLSFRNFKGLRDYSIAFNPKETTISGDNATCKTTIADGFAWLLYGKNSEDNTAFDIKTLNPDNTPIHRLEHEVSGEFIIDENAVLSIVSLKRIYKEKWVKKMGAEVAVFEDHETSYFYNDVPVSASEYKTKIMDLIPGEVARLITNPLYFNGKMKWQDRRNILSMMAGDISDAEIFEIISSHENKDMISNLINVVNSGKQLIDYKKEVAAKRSKIKEEIKQIPARIDEVNRSRPDVKNWDELEADKMRIEKHIQEIDVTIGNAQAMQNRAFQEISTLTQHKFNKEQALAALTRSINSDRTARLQHMRDSISSLKIDVINHTNTVQTHIREKAAIELRITSDKSKRDELRQKWHEWNAKEWEFDPLQGKCGTCAQDLPHEDIVRLTTSGKAAFDAIKAKEMESIIQQGETLMRNNEDDDKKVLIAAELIAHHQHEIVCINELIDSKMIELNTLENTPITTTKEEQDFAAEIQAIVIPEVAEIDNTELTSEKEELTTALDNVKSSLSDRNQIQLSIDRIEELKADERKWSQEIAGFERIEMTIDKFNRARCEFIEKKVSNMFESINIGTINKPNFVPLKFKMFDHQVNGGESETCECMIEGVPYSSLNNAGRINAGIVVINALSKFYGISAPVFIDNRESVVNLHPMEAQIINLVVIKQKVKRLEVA